MRHNHYTHIIFITILLCSTLPVPTLCQSPSPPPQQPLLPNCPYTRSFLLQASLHYTTQPQLSSLIKSQFPGHNPQFTQALIQQNRTKLYNNIGQSQQYKYILHFVGIGVGLVVLCVVVPVLYFSGCCRCVGVCRGRRERRVREGYGGIEARAVVVAAWVGIGAMIAVSVLVYMSGADLLKHYSQFKCSIQLIINDILQGGSYSNPTIKFKGLNYYNRTLNNFYQKVSLLNDAIGNREGDEGVVGELRGLKGMFQRLIRDVRATDRTTGDRYFLSYRKPMTGMNINPDYKYIQSTFKSILGNTTLPNTLINNLTQLLTLGNQTYLSSLPSLFSTLSSHMPTLLSSRTPLLSSLSSQLTNISSLHNSISQMFSTIQTGYIKYYHIANFVVVSVNLVVLGALAVALWMLYFGDGNGGSAKKWKIGVGVLGGVVWGFGVVWFGMLVGFVIGNPMVCYGCQFLGKALSNETYFKQYLLPLAKQNTDLIKISNCLFSSSTPNYYIQTLAPPLPALANISSLLKNRPISSNASTNSPTNSSAFFDTSFPLSYPASLSTSYQLLMSQLQNYRFNKKFDINDSQTIQQLRRISMPTKCIPDSWIPTTSPLTPNPIPCQYPNQSLLADSNTCTYLTFSTRSPYCRGCINSAQISNMFYISDIDINKARKIQQYLFQRYKNVEGLSEQEQVQCDNGTEKKLRIWEIYSLYVRYYDNKNAYLKAVGGGLGKIGGYVREIVRVGNGSAMRAYREAKEFIENNQILTLANLLNKTTTTTKIPIMPPPIIQPKGIPPTMLKQQPLRPSPSSPPFPSSPPPSTYPPFPPLPPPFNKSPPLSSQMDCRIIGTGLLLSKSILCGQSIRYVYYMRVYYSILGTLSIIVCLLIALALYRYEVQQQHMNTNNQNMQMQVVTQTVQSQRQNIKNAMQRQGSGQSMSNSESRSQSESRSNTQSRSNSQNVSQSKQTHNQIRSLPLTSIINGSKPVNAENDGKEEPYSANRLTDRNVNAIKGKDSVSQIIEEVGNQQVGKDRDKDNDKDKGKVQQQRKSVIRDKREIIEKLREKYQNKTHNAEKETKSVANTNTNIDKNTIKNNKKEKEQIEHIKQQKHEKDKNNKQQQQQQSIQYEYQIDQDDINNNKDTHKN